MRVTCLDSDLFSQGASWNLKSRDQADLELRAQWARLVLGGRAGIKQTLSFLPNMKIKTALSLVIGPGQLTVSAFHPCGLHTQHPGLLEVPRQARLGWAAGAAPRAQ